MLYKKKTQAKTQEKFGKTPNEEQLPVMDANEHSRICSTLTILHAPMGFKQKENTLRRITSLILNHYEEIRNNKKNKKITSVIVLGWTVWQSRRL